MVTVELTIEEAENICMMHEYCKRHYSHEYAVNAIQKVRKALKERPQQTLFGESPDLNAVENKVERET